MPKGGLWRRVMRPLLFLLAAAAAVSPAVAIANADGGGSRDEH